MSSRSTDTTDTSALQCVCAQADVFLKTGACQVSQEFALHSLSRRRYDVSGDDYLDASASGYGDDFGSAYEGSRDGFFEGLFLFLSFFAVSVDWVYVWWYAQSGIHTCHDGLLQR